MTTATSSPATFVSTEDGTGLVHIAPAFGADDMEAGRKFNLPTLMTVDAQGRFIDAVGPWRGIFVKDADPLIQQELTQRGLMFKQGIYEHTYPFCWRCDTPLLYYARTTWYIKTTAFKERLLANNQQINWVPDHIRDGRFGEWLENNIDWGLARERYWGTPLPFWVCDNLACDHKECIGSVAELSAKTGRKFMNPRYLAQQMNRWPDPDQPDSEPLDLHRPAVDELTWACPQVRQGTHAPRARGGGLPGSTPARCRWRSGTTRSRTASCSPSSSRPTTSARRSTRRAAGSTRCTRSARCCSTSRASRT